MDIQARMQADLIVQSFVHVAGQLARSSVSTTPEHYAQIRSTADKHNSALNLLLRDVTRMADAALRNDLLTPAEHNQLCLAAARKIIGAQESIARTMAQYAAHKLAA